VLRQSHPEAAEAFKDAYVVEFLQLPDSHLEADLHRGLLAKLPITQTLPNPRGFEAGRVKRGRRANA